MLDGLDDIDWASHAHAFGQASNLPGLLRSVSRGGAEGEEAIGELFGTVWHQGTVYEVSALVVPFLGELAESATLDHSLRELILALIFAIGRGHGYWQRHADAGSSIGSLPDDLPEQLLLEHKRVLSSLRATELVASRLLARIDAFPSRLWLGVAVLAVVAGEYGRSAILRLLEDPPALPPFGALGVQAISEVLTHGRLSQERVQLPDIIQELGRTHAASLHHDAEIEPPSHGIELDFGP